jgi:hypothetical protein
MTKIFALIIVLSFSVSCASYQNDRGLSSVDHGQENDYYERTGQAARF